MNNRVDIEMVNKGLVESREKAKAMIMDKIKEGDNIEIRGQGLKYVSRGGLKLEKAVDVFNLNLDGKVCMDIGASTGGFTDCMLQNGAEKVYAVDVGYGQLAWKLRSDPRVVNMERTNIRYIDFDLLTDNITFISIDVAFISLKLVLPVAFNILSQDGQLVALIKPQFEAGKDEVGKKGVVRDINIHKKVVTEIIDFAYDFGFSVDMLDYSPIKGPEGNIEYLVLLSKKEDKSTVENKIIDEVINNSHGMD